MEEPDLLTRVRDLEREVSALKAPPRPAAEETGFGARCKRLARLLIANWVLLSFLAGVFVAAYVKFRFDLDPLESYRSAATSREMSRFYEQMGDQMMGRSEWKAAELDYRDALQINPHNSGATFGIVKAKVLQPLPGEKWCAGEVVDARLRYLGGRFPDDYQIDFLKALRSHETENDDEAIASLHRCIERNPNFTGCYIHLAYIDMGRGKIAEAEANLVKAMALDPHFPIIKGNLASIYLHLARYSEAAVQLEQSYRISPHAVSAFALGQAYWYLGRFGDALRVHQDAADFLAQDREGQDRYAGGEWTSVFMPLHPGDLDTIKISVIVRTIAQKEALLHFELSIDHALLGQVDAAEREFAFAMKSQPLKEHRQIIQNRIQSIVNLVPTTTGAEQWLGEHYKQLN